MAGLEDADQIGGVGDDHAAVAQDGAAVVGARRAAGAGSPRRTRAVGRVLWCGSVGACVLVVQAWLARHRCTRSSGRRTSRSAWIRATTSGEAVCWATARSASASSRAAAMSAGSRKVVGSASRASSSGCRSLLVGVVVGEPPGEPAPGAEAEAEHDGPGPMQVVELARHIAPDLVHTEMVALARSTRQSTCHPRDDQSAR